MQVVDVSLPSELPPVEIIPPPLPLAPFKPHLEPVTLVWPNRKAWPPWCILKACG